MKPVLARTRSMIERVFAVLEPDTMTERVNHNVWRIARGSATGYLGIVENAHDEGLSLVVVAMNVMSIPAAQTDRFYRRLLDLNYAIRGVAAFGVNDESQVTLIASRLVEDMDESELTDLIDQTATLADEYDDQLKAEFS